MQELADALHSAGAALTGCADLRSLPAEVRGGLPSAVSLAVALDPWIVSRIAQGPTPEYYAEYQRANRLLNRLSGDRLELVNFCRDAVEMPCKP